MVAGGAVCVGMSVGVTCTGVTEGKDVGEGVAVGIADVQPASQRTEMVNRKMTLHDLNVRFSQRKKG